MYHNYRACALEPGSCKYQSPCTLPPVPHHKRSRCNKKSVHCNQDPAQPKTNKQNQCFRTVVLEKTFESPMDSKEIQPDNPKANQPWVLIGTTEAEAPILWPPGAVNSLEKTLMLGKIEGRGRRGCPRMRWLNSMDMNLGKLQEMVKDREAWHGSAESQTWCSNWTTVCAYVRVAFIKSLSWSATEKPTGLSQVPNPMNP